MTPSAPRILLIGATSAIAGACARQWAARGARLALVGRDAQRLQALGADLGARGATVVQTAAMDVSDLSRHAVVLDAAVAALGGLDIVLIAHGTLPDQTACETDAALACREFTTNGLSVIALLTHLAAILARQRHGRLAVITSVAGDRGRPSNYVYGSAKAAVSTFCEGLRARLHRCGVTVTDIRPGFVATPMTQGLPLPAALVAQPDAVARRIVAGIDRGTGVLYAPGFWALIMAIIRAIPRPIFNRLSL